MYTEHDCLDDNENLGFFLKDYPEIDQSRGSKDLVSFLEHFKVVFVKSYTVDFFRKEQPNYPRKCESKFSKGLMDIKIINTK
jgi:hypothetical protein